MFFLVITFGIYHGLVFFPVLLSLLGPGAYDHDHDHDDDDDDKKPDKIKQTTVL